MSKYEPLWKYIKDFVVAALPFIIIGVAIIVIVVNSKKDKENHISEGMCLGMCLGLLIGASFPNEYLGISLSLGMIMEKQLVHVSKSKYKVCIKQVIG